MLTRYLIIFLSLPAFLSCKKDETKITLRGTIRHAYTHAPIANRYLEAFETSPGIFGTDWVRLDSVNSDGSGNFQMVIDMEESGSSLVLQSYREGLFDSTKSENLFTGNPEFYKLSNLPNPVMVDLKPSGRASFIITDSALDSVGADRIEITSIYETQTFMKGQSIPCYFYVEPYKQHPFRWHYVKNGVDGPEFTSMFYVKNECNADGDECSSSNYRLHF